VGSGGEPVALEAPPPLSQQGDGAEIELDAATAGAGLDAELGQVALRRTGGCAGPPVVAARDRGRTTCARRSPRDAFRCVRRGAGRVEAVGLGGGGTRPR